jgi:cell division protein FtsI (penicillin-binding protein 3)
MTEETSAIRHRTHRLRTGTLAGLWILQAAVFMGRSVQLQLIEDEVWRDRARSQYDTHIDLPAERGAVLDRDGRPLVLDARQFRAYVAIREMADPDRSISAIGRVLGLSQKEESKLRASEGGWTAVPRKVSAEDRGRLSDAVRRGLHFEPLAARVYPEGIARNLLGAIDAEGHGRSGLELSLDAYLKGRPGKALTQRDGRGELYRLSATPVSPPVPGHDVVLTIDAELQAIAEDALERAIESSGSSGGDLLIVDPKTGDLLAVASQRHDGSLKVPAFTDPFEPGSTAKPFLLASLLSEGIISLTDSVDVMHGVYKKGRRVIRDVHPYDKLTVAEVVRYSSNVGAALLSERLTDDVQHKYLRDFGFGLSTGGDYPAESGGLLRKPERWSGLSAASLAMGYEISVTSLQLVMAYAALANGGRLLKPRLVKEVRKHSGEVLERRDPQTIRRVIEERVADQITDVLTSVVEGGTGQRAAMSTLTVAGKSGTARLVSGGGYESRYGSSFVAYSPAEDPSLVIFAKLEDPQGAFYGGAVAAPISRSALQAALATRGVELTSGQVVSPADRFDWTQRQAEPDADLRSRLQMLPVDQGAVRFASAGQMHFARTETTATRRLPDLRGLSIRSATARLHALGMQAKLKASGRVEDQSPPPGSPALVGSVVLLR